jgi:hypothetical protein
MRAQKATYAAMAAKNATANASMKMSELGMGRLLEAAKKPMQELSGAVQCFDAEAVA